MLMIIKSIKAWLCRNNWHKYTTDKEWTSDFVWPENMEEPPTSKVCRWCGREVIHFKPGTYTVTSAGGIRCKIKETI